MNNIPSNFFDVKSSSYMSKYLSVLRWSDAGEPSSFLHYELVESTFTRAQPMRKTFFFWESKKTKRTNFKVLLWANKKMWKFSVVNDDFVSLTKFPFPHVAPASAQWIQTFSSPPSTLKWLLQTKRDESGRRRFFFVIKFSSVVMLLPMLHMMWSNYMWNFFFCWRRVFNSHFYSGVGYLHKWRSDESELVK